MTNEQKDRKQRIAEHLPSIDTIQRELSKAESIDDFFGTEGILSQLFAEAMETMLEAELTEHLGYEPYEAKWRRSGNSRNGKRALKVRTSGSETDRQVPRDRNSEFQSTVLEKHKANSNEIENKVLALYVRGNSTPDIQAMLEDLYGIDVSAATISAITDKVWPLMEQWQSGPLEKLYPIVYLDALHVKLRRETDQVDHAIERAGLGHLRLEQRKILSVAVQSRGRLSKLRRRLASVVVGDVRARLLQGARDGVADEAGTADNEYLHDKPRHPS